MFTAQKIDIITYIKITYAIIPINNIYNEIHKRTVLP